MKIRIKFSKHGNMRFIGHLDLMRYFQKCMRRADIPIRYSEGFSPHQIMSFAAPLGIGIESDAEYFDIEILEDAVISRDEAMRRLNAVMVPGMKILDWKEMPKDTKTSMSLLTSADYEVVCPDFDISVFDTDSVYITKVNKNGESKRVDIKPMIYELKKTDSGLFMRLAQGSNANLKPEDVMSVIYGTSDNPDKLKERAKSRIIRKEMYGPDGLTL